MNWTQWQFEYHALRQKEEMVFKTSFTALRQVLVNVLGLNLLKPTNEAGIPKKYSEMTDIEKEQFLPLVAWCGNEMTLKNLAEQEQLEKSTTSVTDPDAEYERQVAAIDAMGGDMEPIIGIETQPSGKIKDPRIAQQEKLLVQAVVDVNGKV